MRQLPDLFLYGISLLQKRHTNFLLHEWDTKGCDIHIFKCTQLYHAKLTPWCIILLFINRSVSTWVISIEMSFQNSSSYANRLVINLCGPTSQPTLWGRCESQLWQVEQNQFIMSCDLSLCPEHAYYKELRYQQLTQIHFL